MRITLGNLALEFANEEEFTFLIESALPKLKELQPQPISKPPVASHLANANPNGEDGPFVKAYLARVNGERFKITQAEKEAGLTREQAAKQRLEMIESGEGIPAEINGNRPNVTAAPLEDGDEVV